MSIKNYTMMLREGNKRNKTLKINQILKPLLVIFYLNFIVLN